MQLHFDSSTNSQRTQDRLTIANVTTWGRGEGIGSNARYLLQLQRMNQTARRNNWARVVFALSSLIVKRGGVV